MAPVSLNIVNYRYIDSLLSEAQLDEVNKKYFLSCKIAVLPCHPIKFWIENFVSAWPSPTIDQPKRTLIY